MTDESRYVKMADLLQDQRSGSNWADEQQEPQQQDSKPKNVWGQVKNVEAIDIAKVAEEDRKAKEAKAAEGNKEWTVAGSKQPGPKDETRRPDAYKGPSPVDKEARTSRPRNPLPDNPPFNAFVGNISYETTASELEKLFENLNVKEARIVLDTESSRPKGFGYVEFHDRASLEQALSFHSQEYKGRTLNVDVAAPSVSKFGGRGERNYDRNFGGERNYDRNFGGERNYGSYGSDKFSGGRGSGRGFGNRGPGERPKLNINPPSKPFEAPAPAPASASAPAPAPASTSVASAQKKSENPFGFDTDKSKLDKAAEERLRMEYEREQRRKEEHYKTSSSTSSGRGFSNTRNDKPYGEKSYGDKGYGDKSYGDKSYGAGRGYGSKDSRPPQSKPQQSTSSDVKPPPKQWARQAEPKKAEEDLKNKNPFSVLDTEEEDQ